MHAQGFHRASLEHILAASGVRKSNFYYHFPSKEALGLAVLEASMAEFVRAVVQPTLGDTTRSPLQRLQAYLMLVARRLEEHGCRRGSLFGNLAAELADEHPLFRERLSRFFAETRRAVAECISEGMARGEIRRDIGAENAARLVMSVTEGAMLLSRTHRDLVELTATTNALLQLLAS